MTNPPGPSGSEPHDEAEWWSQPDANQSNWNAPQPNWGSTPTPAAQTVQASPAPPTQAWATPPPPPPTPPQTWQPAPPPPYQGGYPTPPPRRSGGSGAVIGVVVAVVVLLIIGIGVVAVIANSGGSSKNDASATSTVTSSAASSSAASSSVARPTTSSVAASRHFSYNEVAKDWNFKLGSVSFHADWVEGRDHSSCADFEVDGALTGMGCKYAAEMVYRSEGGALMLTEYVLGMQDADHADTAAETISDSDIKLRPGSYIGNFAVGKWVADAEKDFVVVTFVTTTPAVTEDRAKDYLHYRQTDMTGALSFR
ncbi:hypothetical protein [Nocardia aurantia]|uniref:Uncharacterized protein n=1 Tax=Nocardia aurantia TaxID=2585199 RepID=A0A7K0E0W2_9NOCA|nr:hypothetical protein [Nocardia aurantia]MQY31615.1 hypothetical protein [Nocardia aurantia]